MGAAIERLTPGAEAPLLTLRDVRAEARTYLEAMLVLAMLPAIAVAQGFGDLQGGASAGARQKSYVTYAAEPAVVAAGRWSVVEVHLRVAEGFHVNSHAPKSDLLIPTAVTLEAPDAETKVGAVEYPAGTTFRLAADPGEALDVYTGAVVLRVPVTAAAGEHVLRGVLKYQACDMKACYPPRSLALAVPFTAK